MSTDKPSMPETRSLDRVLLSYLEYFDIDVSYQNYMPSDEDHYPLLVEFDAHLAMELRLNARVHGRRAIAVWVFSKEMLKKFIDFIAVLPGGCGPDALVVMAHRFFGENYRNVPEIDKLIKTH